MLYFYSTVIFSFECLSIGTCAGDSFVDLLVSMMASIECTIYSIHAASLSKYFCTHTDTQDFSNRRRRYGQTDCIRMPISLCISDVCH